MDRTMQEVNVRVAVRIRPLLPKEKLAGEPLCVGIPKSNLNELVVGRDRRFTFDHIISSRTPQEDVFESCIEPLVKSCFDGYNATVFAYGQTGSGKTYTIGGGNFASQTEEDFGIIPRAIKNMYDRIESTPGRSFSIRISYVEVYKEDVRDLLDSDSSRKDLHIREDDKGNTVITGATEMYCESMDEVMSCLEQGSSYRHTATTQMNDHSSRSHSIFTINIEQKWSDDLDPLMKKKKRIQDDEIIDEEESIEHYMCAKFHFVDLAGSERANKTGNVGDRFKESVHINGGLLALGNVISALADPKKKVTHIPYRDSKITRLLKDSLGGNANTIMICCISPASSSFDETLNALKYAQRARNIKNKPIVNRDQKSIRFEEMQSEIKALREELKRQRTSIFSSSSNTEFTKAVQEAGQVKDMEDKLIRLQTECAHYKMIAEEAYKHLTEIMERDLVSKSQNHRLRDWMDLMEEIKNKVPHTLSRGALENQTIVQLTEELKQCKKDLMSDEEIFAEKSKEVGHLQDKVSQLIRDNAVRCKAHEEAMETQSHQQEQLVEKQMKIEELQQQVKELEKQLEDQEDELLNSQKSIGALSEGPPTTTRRAKSVPAHMIGSRGEEGGLRETTGKRNIHTSPALFSIERVMQGFRARSQLLVSRLEDNDDVMQPRFKDDIIDEDDGEIVQPAVDKSPFLRNGGNRGTYTKAKSRLARRTKSQEDEIRRSQTDDEKLTMRENTELIKIKVNNKTGKKSTKDQIQEAALGKAAEAVRRKKLKQTEINVRQSTQKMKDLTINIRMKEQLINELVKTGKDAQSLNKQYEEKIQALEREKQGAKQELNNIQRAMVELEQKEHHEKHEKERLQSDFRKRIESEKIKIHALQKKQRDTERVASLAGGNDKRIHDLESAIDKMKSQQQSLHHKLKEESEKKTRLQKEMQREQQRTRDLELKNERQTKILKIKTEELGAAHRKLRNGSMVSLTSEEQVKIDEQRKWLDSEIEKVLEQRKNMEELEKELERREEILIKKESMLAEKSELEIKKLRSSQVLNKDIVLVSNKIEKVERSIKEKAEEMTSTPKEKQASLIEELKALSKGRDKLQKQRALMDAKLHEGGLLSTQEERRLIGIDEAIEALDAAMEYKNEAIANRQQDLRKSVQVGRASHDNLMMKLQTLSAADTRSLLAKYFDKVIDLREGERKKEMVCSEYEMKVDEQEHFIRDLEGALQRSGMDADRKLTRQQQEYEKKIQMLMQQIAEREDRSTSSSISDREKDSKITQLEKDLYYYKKTSRDLKKKIREIASAKGFLSSPSGDADILSDLPVTPREESRPSTKNGTHSRPGSGHHSARDGQRSGRGDGNSYTKENYVSPRDGHMPLVSPRGQVTNQGEKHKEGTTPVRISRKDLRRMSEEEVSLRKSGLAVHEQSLPADSLEVGKNPWG